ncbi:phosphotriesterase family protein [Jatrophihabitans sp. DSM 45814]
MKSVQTVRGPIDLADIGTTLMHEHLFIFTTEVKQDFPELSWRGTQEQRYQQALQALTAAKNRGVRTMVDLTVLGLGRSVEDVIQVNREIDLNIIMSTGFYTYDALPAFYANRPTESDTTSKYGDILTDMFVKDITEGIGDSGVKAAMLKCCTEEAGITPNIQRIFKAVSRAHRLTGAPITTHSNPLLRNGLDQQEAFSEHGVDLSRVTIGHSGDTTDLDYLRRIMDAGSYVGMDRFGGVRPGTASDEERIEVVARLCELGYANRMILSHDAICHMDIRADWYEEREITDPSTIYSFIPEVVLPALRSRGVSDDHITQMTERNPQDIFANTEAY